MVILPDYIIVLTYYVFDNAATNKNIGYRYVGKYLFNYKEVYYLAILCI